MTSSVPELNHQLRVGQGENRCQCQHARRRGDPTHLVDSLVDFRPVVVTTGVVSTFMIA